MLKTLTAIIATLLIIGCSSKSEEVVNVEPKLVVGKTLGDLKLNDQFEKSHTISADTYKLIFALDKEPAHICNDFFNSQEADYLQKHNAQFIADISTAPSLIRSLFILPGLKDFKHTVMLLDDKTAAAPFRKDVETEKIVVVYIINKTITKIESLSTEAELKKMIEDESPMSLIAPMINKVLN
ncbi:hypothetical protein GJV85_02345 [Sulfurimonas aquatica]|uniref:Uncharacterized protein n=1 Tax=Sulfurimonas aquatica TaxID=2672570 RepID=A0A975GBW4_9BACT|nr:hypothetical protein [Sulfurimonas aquatica]QSZ41000.1 hypothetical protein GJV85_02345 [Sulfurimonas aquatica]